MRAPNPPLGVTQRAVLRSAVLNAAGGGWVHAFPGTIAVLRERGYVAGPERPSTGGRVACRITETGAHASTFDVPGQAREHWDGALAIRPTRPAPHSTPRGTRNAA